MGELGDILSEMLALVGAVLIALVLWALVSPYIPFTQNINKFIGVNPQA